MASVECYSVAEAISASAKSEADAIAIRWRGVALISLLFPFACIGLFVYALHSKGITFGSFFYLFGDSISPVKPILGLLALAMWLVIFPRYALPAMFAPRTAVAFRDGKFLFFGRELEPLEIDHFERRIHGLLSDLVVVLKNGSEISRAESFVRGFPVR